MNFGDMFSSKSLARKVARAPAHKPGIHVEWPEVPAQQPKDYQVIHTETELIAYLKRCEDLGICGFDYETTISKEYRKRCSKIMAPLANEASAAKYALEALTAAGTKTEIRRAKSRLTEAEKAFSDFYKEDYMKAPLDPHKATICTVSLSAAPNEARVVFIGNPGENRVQTTLGRVMAILNEYLFSNSKIIKIAVNLAFETKQSLEYKCFIQMPVADPLIMWVRCMQVAAPHKITNPKQPSKGKGLKEMTKELFGVDMTHFDAVLADKGVEFFDEVSADDPEAIYYSAADSDYAVQHYLYWKQVAEQIPKYDSWLHEIEMPFTRVIGMMEYNGMPWNDAIANAKAKGAVELRDTAIGQIVALGKKYDFDVMPGKTGKTGSVQTLLWDILKCPKAALSDRTGKPSLDAEAILDMKFMVESKLYSLDEEDDMEENAVEIAVRPEYEHRDDILELLDLMGKVTKYTTLLSSHIEGRQKFVNPVTGRIHAHYTQWTETGRLNSSKPKQHWALCA